MNTFKAIALSAALCIASAPVFAAQPQAPAPDARVWHILNFHTGKCIPMASTGLDNPDAAHNALRGAGFTDHVQVEKDASDAVVAISIGYTRNGGEVSLLFFPSMLLCEVARLRHVQSGELPGANDLR